MKEKINPAAEVSPQLSKPTFKEKLCKQLDIQPDVLPGEGMIEIRGKNFILIRGGCYILVYGPNEMVLAFKHHNLAIRGERLVCTAYNAGAVSIEGSISCVSFEEVSG